ncbi:MULTISPECIES: efflux RND transporter permease subunit [Cyanophyceae]|uniref:efflux RND transporter permease subunit n=1 Tax=Cyanophyceae TaxID=3028117 RepID=UPI001686B6B2|nr:MULTISPECIES: efflux RND transporter permease subunit [Cyanophyceae]MBD1915317.1 efflux RND transporter permease subunit [Phormidium sp. FACHB-77]MBD2032812.1 efflux RND transporter permease subunit [Phormidium sp. FACHB-322]MBD2051837.1 efflux RND transporter permease subunit [Leptolyngbya sp. FACHB-60]
MPRPNLNQLREQLNISRLALQNRGLTIFCWIVIGVAGLFAFSSLKYALFPDITFPVVLVNATAPVETALETEAQLTVPLEAQLQPLAGLTKLNSTTSPGRAILRLNFEVNTALGETTAAVEEAIAQTELSTGFDYEIIPLNLNEATAISYALTSEDLPPAELAALVEAEILPTLRDIPGVLRVDLRGTGSRATASGDGSFLAELQNPPTLIRFNGETALAVQVVKQGEANTLEVVDRVEAAIAQIRDQQPQVEIALAATQADFIRSSTQATIDALVGAIVLAVLVILGFLRSWRATVITALAIPLSVLGTAIVMAIYGFNLETITLLALAIVIGIIVDDAIVEIENIMRHMEAGATPQQAALRATDEIALTVSASTLTIVAVFLPVALMGGTVGQFFKPFGLTVSAAVLFSLLVARTLTPVLAVYWLKSPNSPQSAAPAPSEPAAEVIPALLADTVADSWLEQRYSQLLAWSLHHRWIVVGLAIASLIAGIAIIPLIPQGFIPQLDQGQFLLNYQVPLPQRPGGAQLPPPGQLPTGLSASQATAAAEAAAAAGRSQLLQRTLQQADDLEATVARLPEVESVLTTVGGRGRPNEGSLYIKLREERDRDTAAVQAQLRQDLPTRTGLETSVEDLQFVDTGGEKPLQVALLGDDVVALQTAAAEIQAQVEALPGFADVRISGAENTADAIVEVNRQNGERVAIVSANLSDGNALGDATSQVVEIAESVVPPGVRIDLAGDSARAGEVLGSFGRILILAVICMMLVLLVPFGRLLEPAVVGLSLPLSIVGAMLALWITRSDFGIVSLLGLLFLLGLLDKNAVLLMDYINQLRRAGVKRTDAIMKTGLVRLRPILMTTASTVLGMVPIAIGLGAGAELRQPMAVAIIGGLLTSTLLSLVVVPVLYTLLEDGWLKLTKRSA